MLPMFARVSIVLLSVLYAAELAAAVSGDRRPPGMVERPSSEKVFNVIDFGAQGDGVTDDCTALQSALDAAEAAGGAVVYVPRGTYALGGQLSIGSNTTLRGDGASSVLKLRRGQAVTLLRNRDLRSGNENIVIESISFRGDGVPRVGYVPYVQLVWLTFVRGARISNASFVGAANDGLVLEYCKDVTVRDCFANDNAKVGIYLSGSDYITVRNNHCIGNGVAGIAFAASWYSLARGNVCMQSGVAGIGGGRDTQYSDFVANIIDGFDVSAEPIGSLPFAREHGTAPYRPGALYGISNCRVAENTIHGTPGTRRNGLRLIGGSNNLIQENEITRVWGFGILLHGTTDSLVRLNVVGDFGENAIGGGEASPNRVGILVVPLDKQQTASNNVVEENVVYVSSNDQTRVGIQIAAGAGGCVVRYNTVKVRPALLVESESSTAYNNTVP